VVCLLNKLTRGLKGYECIRVVGYRNNPGENGPSGERANLLIQVYLETPLPFNFQLLMSGTSGSPPAKKPMVDLYTYLGCGPIP